MADPLTHEEFERLVSDEHGALMPRPSLIQSFDVEELLADNWQEPKMQALKTLRLNVVEPTMYTDRKGQVLLVLPHGVPSYHTIESIFPVKKAWLYTISATVGSELNERIYLFRYGRDEEDGNEPIPAYQANKPLTH